jgi:hypothetical protein
MVSGGDTIVTRRYLSEIKRIHRVNRERQARLAAAVIVASDAELIAAGGCGGSGAALSGWFAGGGCCGSGAMGRRAR